MRTLWMRTVAVGIATTAIAAACGGSSGEAGKSAGAIAADAARATSSASSVHVSGSANAQGQSVPVDLTLNAAGATGKVTFAGVPVDLIAMKGNLYIRGAASVLGGFLGPKAAAMIGRHWVQLSTSMPQLAQFSALTDKTQLVQQLLTAKSPSKVGTRTIAGLKTVELRGYGTDGNGTLFVAATGTSYPVQLVTSVGTVHFSGWNAPITVTAPSDVISLASLTG